MTKISVLAALMLLAAVLGAELPPRKLENSRELQDERELQETAAPSAAPEQPNLTREFMR
jgi:hypothetical protein